MSKFVVDVDFVTNHDSLKAGFVKEGTHRVFLFAENEDDACLIAAQIVASTQGIPTAIYLIV